MAKQMYINGEWVSAPNNKTFPVYNPATSEIIDYVPNGGYEEALQASKAAANAFPKWASKLAEERANMILKFRDKIIEHKNELIETLCLESGKPILEADSEINAGLNFFTWYAEEAKRIYGDIIPASASDKRIAVIKQPIGVVGIITPWNFPFNALAKKIAPALAAGCTVVIKPAEETPLTAFKLAELAEKTGFNKGVLNVVTGNPKEIGEAWLQDDHVKLITFTGSTEVGKILMRGAANKVKKLSLELGGHAPFIIFEDADLEKAVEGLIASKFRNNGQTCVCANRVFVHENILQEFINKLKEAMNQLIVGKYDEPNVTTGPLINKSALEKVERHVQDAVNKGATIEVGGKRIEKYPDGYFYEPTILCGIDKSMDLFYEETFGPVIPIATFTDDEEVIEEANDTVYGLAAYIFTESLKKAIQVSEKIESGIVGVNDGLPSIAQAPFGGWKESGIGKEGGKEGIEEFLETKYISIRM